MFLGFSYVVQQYRNRCRSREEKGQKSGGKVIIGEFMGSSMRLCVEADTLDSLPSQGLNFKIFSTS